MPYIGQGLTEGRRRVETFIATANQTTFNIIYDAGYVDVYQNGILLAEADYTATNGSQVVLAVGAALNDEITIIAHQLFSVTDTVSAAQGGTFTGAITASGGVVGNVTGTISNISNHLIDEDNMVSNDATKVPSQQSVKAYVDTEVSGLVDSAPNTLDTLNELAAALGDDANFSTTITNSIATKLPLAGGTLTGNLTMENTDAGSAAGPEFVLFRNSASAADADYLGQIKFDGKNDAGQSIVYAKITGKILDASDGTEDGIIEIAHKKAGSNNISARFRSDSLQLINGTNLTVAGTTDLTGDLTVDTNTLHVDTTNNRVGIGTSSPSALLDVNSPVNGIQAHFGTSSNRELIISSIAANGYDDALTKFHKNSSVGEFAFLNSGGERLRIASSGNVGIGTNSPGDKLTIQSSTGQLRLQGTTNTNKNISIFYNESGDYGQINVDESGVNQKDLWVTGLNLKFGRSTSSESMRIKDDGRLLIGTDTSSVYYNSTSQYAGDVVVDMNIANNVTDLVLINSNNSFGSTVDFATNNSAGNPVRHGLMGAVPVSTTAGSESGRLIFSTKNTTDNNIVERVRIETDGALVVNNSGGDAQMYFGGTSGSNRMYLARSGNDSFLWNVDSGVMRFGTNDSEAMRIDSSGNVSIGGIPSSGGGGSRWLSLDTPSSNAYSGGILYKINGGTKAYHYVENDMIMHQTTAGVGQKFYAGTGVAMTLLSNGNVGIGTTAPEGALHLHNHGSQYAELILERDSSGVEAKFDIKPYAGSLYIREYTTSGNNSTNDIIQITDTGHFLPVSTSQNIGSTAKPWQNIYTQDMHLSNESRDTGNEIDGTKGNWTIQEGAEDLYIINNKSGKRFRFKLEELD